MVVESGALLCVRLNLVAYGKQTNMACVIAEYSKCEVRAVIRFLQAEGVNQSEIHRRLEGVYGPKVLSRKEVSVWCKKFKDGRTDLIDDPEKNRGRPRTSHTDENCSIVEGLIREDRRIKVREIEEMTGIPKSCVHEIICDLNFRKVSSRWVPKMLSENHKTNRMSASLQHLTRYQREGDSFIESIITGDETWVYEFTPESKQQSMMWKHPDSPVHKKFKTQPSARKTMATVFWDSEGLLLCEFLEPRTTINSDRYCETLQKLHTAIRRKRPGRLRQGVKLLHDGARPHTSNQTKEWLTQRKWEVLQHPPYSPDLAPSDFYLFGPLKKFLAGKRFANQQELQDTVVDYFNRLDRQHYREGMFKLLPRWDKCLNLYGEYVEK